MSTPIQNAVAGDLLRHAFSLQGRQNLQLEDFVLPTIELGSLKCGFAPAPCRTVAVRSVQAAVAAQFAVWLLTAPAGVLLEILELVITPSSAGSLEFEMGTPSGITGATTLQTGAVFTDDRVKLGGPGPSASPSGQLFKGTQAAGVSGEYAVPIATAGTIYRPVDFIVGRAPFPASSSLGIFVETAVNEQAVLSMLWREYYLV